VQCENITDTSEGYTIIPTGRVKLKIVYCEIKTTTNGNNNQLYIQYTRNKKQQINIIRIQEMVLK